MPDLDLLHRAALRGSFEGDEEIELYAELRNMTAAYIARHLESGKNLGGKNLGGTLRRMWDRTSPEAGRVFPNAARVVTETRVRYWLTDNAAIVSTIHEHIFSLSAELSDAELVVIAKVARMLLAPVYIRDNGVQKPQVALVFGVIFGECAPDRRPDSKRR